MKHITLRIAFGIFLFSFSHADQAMAAAQNYEKAKSAVSAVSAAFDATTEKIALSILTEKNQRVTIVVTNRQGSAVYKDRVMVDQYGYMTEISLEGMPEGIYYLSVKGHTISHLQRFRKKQ